MTETPFVIMSDLTRAIFNFFDRDERLNVDVSSDTRWTIVDIGYCSGHTTLIRIQFEETILFILDFRKPPDISINHERVKDPDFRSETDRWVNPRQIHDLSNPRTDLEQLLTQIHETL